MRVLHSFGELRASGAEVMLREAIPGLRAAGVEPVVLSTGSTVGDLASDFHALGVEVIHLPFARNLSHLLAFGRVIRSHKIDLVHLHAERANAAMGLTAKGCGTQVVRTVHTSFRYTGRLRAIRRLERRALRTLGVRHIAIGPSVAENELEWLGNPTITIPNWIGERFRPPTAAEKALAKEAHGVPANAIAVVTVGQCLALKNHREVLKALPGVAALIGQPLVYLHVGDGGWEDAEKKLAGEIARPELDLRFLGRLDDVRSVLWAADLYCMPSSYEGTPIAGLEALACGLPAVVSDVPGMRGLVRQGPNIEFVRPDHRAVSAGLATVCSRLSAARAAASVRAEEVRRDRGVAQAVASLLRLYQSAE